MRMAFLYFFRLMPAYQHLTNLIVGMQSNFCMGLGAKERQCFMVDFGLAKKYRDSEGRVNPARPVAEFRGTSHYASVNAHKSKVRSRAPRSLTDLTCLSTYLSFP